MRGESLSIPQARKLALLSQRLPPRQQGGAAVEATLVAVEHLGYVQIDTISVVQRAHHHTLWNRNPRYQVSHLDQLLDEKKVFEYWAHAAAYLPFCDYRFSLPRKQALITGEQSHWFDRDARMEKHVLERIMKEGPLMAKDFEHTGQDVGEWQSKPAKRALENLFMQGDLMVSRRINFHKVYDLTERVLPDGTDTSTPDPEEYARFLITSFLRAHGLGRASEIAYLRNGMKPVVSAALEDMTSSGELVEVHVGAEAYYAMPASFDLLSQLLARSKLKILSPFDNLVIQRKRVQALFGFDYLIECYVPKAKRQYGYFSLPILWDGKLVARMDCKAERKAATLHVLNLVLEPGVRKVDAFDDALQRELESFMRFCGCGSLVWHTLLR